MFCCCRSFLKFSSGKKKANPACFLFCGTHHPAPSPFFSAHTLPSPELRLREAPAPYAPPPQNPLTKPGGQKKDACMGHPCLLFMKLLLSGSRPNKPERNLYLNAQESCVRRLLFHGIPPHKTGGPCRFYSSMTGFSGNMAIMAFTAS